LAAIDVAGLQLAVGVGASAFFLRENKRADIGMRAPAGIAVACWVVVYHY
jgi:hypothetical protein